MFFMPRYRRNAGHCFDRVRQKCLGLGRFFAGAIRLSAAHLASCVSHQREDRPTFYAPAECADPRRLSPRRMRAIETNITGSTAITRLSSAHLPPSAPHSRTAIGTVGAGDIFNERDFGLIASSVLKKFGSAAAHLLEFTLPRSRTKLSMRCSNPHSGRGDCEVGALRLMKHQSPLVLSIDDASRGHPPSALNRSKHVRSILRCNISRLDFSQYKSMY